MKQSAIDRRRLLRQIWHEVGRLAVLIYVLGMACFYLALREYLGTLAFIWIFISFVVSYLVYFFFVQINKSRDGDF